MIRFGQMPRGAIAALQVPVFALVGALSTVPPIEPPEPPIIPPSYGGGGHHWYQEERATEHHEELLEVLEILLMHDIL
mgnify:FL=1